MKSMLLLALVPAIALAQKPPAACPLLTDAEISAATGMKVGKAQSFDLPSKKTNGCMWKVGETGMVNVSVNPMPPTKAQHDAAIASYHQMYDRLKAAGWTVTESKIGNALCHTATPPKAQSDQTPAMTGCVAVAKGFALAVGFAAPHGKLAPEKIKPLVDDAVKRLP